MITNFVKKYKNKFPFPKTNLLIINFYPFTLINIISDVNGFNEFFINITFLFSKNLKPLIKKMESKSLDIFNNLNKMNYNEIHKFIIIKYFE